MQLGAQCIILSAIIIETRLAPFYTVLEIMRHLCYDTMTYQTLLMGVQCASQYPEMKKTVYMITLLVTVICLISLNIVTLFVLFITVPTLRFP